MRWAIKLFFILLFSKLRNLLGGDNMAEFDHVVGHKWLPKQPPAVTAIKIGEDVTLDDGQVYVAGDYLTSDGEFYTAIDWENNNTEIEP